jgi:ribosomal-protein-alanine N-acetyltransferase
MSDKPRKERPQSFTVVWEFRVKPGKQRGFERAYGPEGDWVQLFRRSEDYLGTELIRDHGLRLRYVTLDHWNSRQAYLRFKKENRRAYQVLDAKCEALTTRERRIGEFDGFESKENNSSLAGPPFPGRKSCPELARAAATVRTLPTQNLAENLAGGRPRPPYASSGVRIRPASLADIRGMIALERDSPSAAHWPEPAYARVFSADSTTRIAIVAEDREASVRGFAIARVVGEEVELENIVVDRKRRNQGLGTQLIEKIMQGSKSRNATRLFLEVRESNPAARALYEKCGLVLSGRRRAYYTSPSEDAVLYTRKLGNSVG